jgi:hypothetical protein
MSARIGEGLGGGARITGGLSEESDGFLVAFGYVAALLAIAMIVVGVAAILTYRGIMAGYRWTRRRRLRRA